MAKIKFEVVVDKKEIWDFSDFWMTEEEWNRLTDDEKYEELTSWAGQHIDMGFKVIP
jgi:hypothetical protein